MGCNLWMDWLKITDQVSPSFQGSFSIGSTPFRNIFQSENILPRSVPYRWTFCLGFWVNRFQSKTLNFWYEERYLTGKPLFCFGIITNWVQLVLSGFEGYGVSFWHGKIRFPWFLLFCCVDHVCSSKTITTRSLFILGNTSRVHLCFDLVLLPIGFNRVCLVLRVMESLSEMVKCAFLDFFSFVDHVFSSKTIATRYLFSKKKKKCFCGNFLACGKTVFFLIRCESLSIGSIPGAVHLQSAPTSKVFFFFLHTRGVNCLEY